MRSNFTHTKRDARSGPGHLMPGTRPVDKKIYKKNLTSVVWVSKCLTHTDESVKLL